MKKPTRFVGLDVHRDTVVVAIAPPEGPAEDHGVLPHDLPRLKKFFDRALKEGPLRACYEAGGCGFGLQRALASWGVPCEVIAPSLIPQRSGDHRKTDRRDARKLATFYRAGELTPVHVPTETEERARSLVRAREAIARGVRVSKQHVLKFLLLRGHVYRGGKSWTRGFLEWLRGLELHELDQDVLSTHLALLEQKQAHLSHLDERIEEVSREEPHRDVVARLRCLRGFDTLTALAHSAEIGDIRRFESPRRLMSFVGLTASEHSSGNSVRHGGITKAGNSHLRRFLVEAAWHNWRTPRTSLRLRKRREGQSPAVVALAVRAQYRLHKRYVKLTERLPGQKAVTAIARELVGFVWALMQGTPESLAPRVR